MIEKKKHNLIYLVGDGTKSSSPLNINNWTLPKNNTAEKKKPLDDSYAAVSRPSPYV